MNYLNKIILCFTEDKVIGYQLKDKIVSEYGDEFERLKDFIDVYTRREVYNKRMESLKKKKKECFKEDYFKENKVKRLIH